MKKNIIFYAFAAVLVFASCQKEDSATQDPEQPSSVLETITATTSSTKTTTQDGVNVLWENGDQIGLWVGGSNNRTVSAIYTASLEEPNSSASFVRTGEVSPGSYENKMFALYPASSLNKWASNMNNPANSRVYVNLPQSQTAVVGAWDENSGILASSSTTSEFQFNHIMSYLKFTIDASSTPFVSLKVTANDGRYLAGENIGVLYGDQIAYDPSYTSGSYYSTVTLSNSENVVFAPGTYYIAILPGTFTKGFTFTFENADGKTAKKELVKEITLEASDVANMGTIGALAFEDVTIENSGELGTVYAEGGDNLGVIFWIDEDDPTKCKIISGASNANLAWGTVSKYDWAENINTNDGTANHEYVLGLTGSSATDYPAVYFCKNLGEGWRLPTISEMESLIKTYYGISGSYDAETSYFSVEPYASNAAKFELELTKCSAQTTLAASAATWYWTGQSYIKEGDSNSGKTCRVKVSPQILVSGAGATNKCNVRCVRDVELQ